MQEIADIYNQIEIEQQKEEADTTELEQNLQDLQKEAKEIYSPSNVSLKYYNDKKIVPLIKELETMKLELVSEQQKIQSFLNRITQSKSSIDNAKNSLDNNGTENVTKNLQYDIEQTKSELSKLENILLLFLYLVLFFLTLQYLFLHSFQMLLLINWALFYL